jgi:hypothetical protein
LIDWERVHKNDPSDSDFVFDELKTEIIRHVFWHTPFEESALIQLHKRGRIKTREIALKLLKTRIGKYNNFMDGRQTPMGKEELVNYAQHATATCCRKCLEAWHNIDMEIELTPQQLEFCTNLVMKYIDERVPQLVDEPLASEEEAKIKTYEHH